MRHPLSPATNGADRPVLASLDLVFSPRQQTSEAVDLAATSPVNSTPSPGVYCHRGYESVDDRQSKFELWGWGQDSCASFSDVALNDAQLEQAQPDRTAHSTADSIRFGRVAPYGSSSSKL